MTRSGAFLLALFALTAVACGGGDSGDRGNGGKAGASGTNPFANAGKGGAAGTAIPNGPKNMGTAAQAGGPTGSGGDPGVKVGDLDGCTGSSVTAPPASNPKVDIVWIVDASTSMVDEQARITKNMASFADAITAANLDVHIVMMTMSASLPPPLCPEVPADPLANTSLAGDPRYLFVQSLVDSHNLFSVLTDSYSQYQSFLRPDSVVHVVTVTDDESEYKGLGSADERASTFKTDYEALLGKTFIQHTIASQGPGPCIAEVCEPDPNAGICAFIMLACSAAAPGDSYYKLAEVTGGLGASICLNDWAVIFDPLTAAVIESAPLPCNYAIPPPPKGESLDPALVNVGFVKPGAAATEQEILPKAGALGECGDTVAWYYDSPSAPTEVLLCPAACSHVAGGGTLNVAFGCATVTVD